jgi:hypothetical protein
MNRVIRQLVAMKNFRKTQMPATREPVPSIDPIPFWMLVGFEMLAIELLAGFIRLAMA